MKGRVWGRRTGRILSFLAVALAVGWLVRALGSEGGEALRRRLVAAHPGYLALAAVANLARYGLWALRWQLILQPLRQVRYVAALRALMISVFLNTVLPAARPLGGIVRARALERAAGPPAGPVYAAAVVDQMGYSIVSALVGALCLPWALLPSSSSSRFLAALTAGSAGLAGLAVLASAHRRQQLAGWLRRRLPGTAMAVGDAAAGSRQLLGRPRTYFLAATGGSVVWMSSAVVIWLAGRATGSQFTLGSASAAWALGSLAGALTGTPGGVGATESAAVLPLVQQGLAIEGALAAVLVARGLHYASAILIGGAMLLWQPAAVSDLAAPAVPGGTPPPPDH